jgi:hypothetical protein
MVLFAGLSMYYRRYFVCFVFQGEISQAMLPSSVVLLVQLESPQ